MSGDGSGGGVRVAEGTNRREPGARPCDPLAVTTAHPTVLALGVASGLALAACSGDEPSGPPPPPDGGSGTITTFSPEGCGFSIAARPEYVDFARGSTVVGATPEIRRV